MSIEISVPGKVVLFGEWAVTVGAPGIATALGCRLHLRVKPFNSPHETELISEGERAVLQEETIPGFFRLVSQTILLLREESDDNLWRGKRLEFHPGWKAQEGLGSSSAVVLALLLAQAAGGTFARDHIWLRGREILRLCQNPLASGLDLAAQSQGETIILQGEEALPVLLDFPTNLRLIHTGAKVKTDQALSERPVTQAFAQGIQDSVLQFIRTRDWIEAIRQHDTLLRNFGVVPSDIQQASDEWKKSGWIEALKTTGAGGGDALLTWVREESEDKLLADLERRGWWMSRYAWASPAGRIDAS